MVEDIILHEYDNDAKNIVVSNIDTELLAAQITWLQKSEQKCWRLTHVVLRNPL